MNRSSRGLLREWGLLALLLGALLLAAQHGGWLERANLWAYDLALISRDILQPAAAPDDPVIVAIDETSLAEYGRWPWPRQRLAELLERLAEANAGPALLDIVLSEPQGDASDADARLQAALRHLRAAHGDPVLPIFMPEAGDGDTAIRPVASLASAARLGHVQALVDIDGVSRRLLPVELMDGQPHPHVAWTILRQEPPEDGKPLGVPFAGPPGHFTRIAAADLLKRRVSMERLRGRIVLVGATANGMGDMLATPLAGRGGAMPGVEFIANAIHGVRTGRMIRTLSPLGQATISLGLLLSLLVLFLFVRPRIALAATFALCGAALLGAWGGLAWFSFWWPPATLIAVIALAYPLWSWRRLEASLIAMERETRRIAGLSQPTAEDNVNSSGAHFLDPVEKRIQAVSRAVDKIANDLAVNGDPASTSQHREEMMRHLAHDLRSPIISLRGLADELRADPHVGTDNPALQRIDRCARRALELSEQFILFGHAETVAPESFGDASLLDILHRASDDLWEDASRTGGRVLRRTTLDGAWVRGDSRLLHRALLNLGWNALRHGPAQAPITVFIDTDAAGNLRLGVLDRGRGFTGTESAPSSTPDVPPGFGLGLAFVRRVAEKHGATLASAIEAEGFAIWLHFPARQVEVSVQDQRVQAV